MIYVYSQHGPPVVQIPHRNDHLTANGFISDLLDPAASLEKNPNLGVTGMLYVLLRFAWRLFTPTPEDIELYEQ